MKIHMASVGELADSDTLVRNTGMKRFYMDFKRKANI